MKKIILMLVTVLVTASYAFAIPSLQLDVSGGTYDVATETTVANSNVFDLYALLQVSNKTPITERYYISAALTPKTGFTTNGIDVGSFSFNGTTINATRDMVYGVPPLETNLAFTSGDLSKHNIYETYFAEFSFLFDATQVNAYNTIDGSAATGMLNQKTFTIDLSNLADGYGIHFDLYSESTRNGDISIDKFAPFSHDAEGTHITTVPEPGTVMLFGIGMFGLAIFGKRKMYN
ncbi:MAG: choice-of-anchor N protein [Desulfuromonadaceae bacterium]|nr:choice-of-anchor N protein [Desulfuromonadaceae bacterium]